MVEEISSGEVIQEGWLLKRSRLVKKWRNRWFLLTRQSLFSFKDRNSCTNATEIIQFRDFISVKPLESKKKPYCLCISLKNRTFHLQASTSEDRDRWIQAIARVAFRPETTQPPPQTTQLIQPIQPQQKIEQFEIGEPS